jgi:hypothetical protein
MSARATGEAAYLRELDELTQLIHSASRNLVLQLVRNGLRSLFSRRSELGRPGGHAAARASQP